MPRRGIALAWYGVILVGVGSVAWVVGWGGLAGGCWILGLSTVCEAGDSLGLL